MSRSSNDLTVGNVLEKFKELIDIFDKLIAADLEPNREIYKEVRRGINDSRRKLVYQFNGERMLARNIEIYSPQALEELRQAIIKARKEGFEN